MNTQEFLYDGRIGRPPRLLEYKGLRLTAAQWAIARDLQEKTIWKRLERGETVEQVLALGQLKPNQYTPSAEPASSPAVPEKAREQFLAEQFSRYREGESIARETAIHLARAAWDNGYVIGSGKLRLKRRKTTEQPGEPS